MLCDYLVLPLTLACIHIFTILCATFAHYRFCLNVSVGDVLCAGASIVYSSVYGCKNVSVGDVFCVGACIVDSSVYGCKNVSVGDVLCVGVSFIPACMDVRMQIQSYQQVSKVLKGFVCG